MLQPRGFYSSTWCQEAIRMCWCQAIDLLQSSVTAESIPPSFLLGQLRQMSLIRRRTASDTTDHHG